MNRIKHTYTFKHTHTSWKKQQMEDKQINKHHCNCFHSQFSKEMSLQQKIFKDLDGHGRSTLRQQTSGQGTAHLKMFLTSYGTKEFFF